MPCRYDPDQDFRFAALVVGLCLGAALLVTALGMVRDEHRHHRAQLPPEPQCWDIATGQACEPLHSEPRALRNR